MEWPELESAVTSLASGATILELGTGQGSMFRYLAGLLARNPGCSLLTLDADPRAAEGARRHLRTLPPVLRQRISAVSAEIVDWAGSQRSSCHLVVASAFLSAVPLTRPFGLDEVIEAIGTLLLPSGMLFLEDYLPLPPPGLSAEAGSWACALWRWYKALAELAGLPHHVEWPPSWVAARLRERGFTCIRWVADERQPIRSDASWQAVVGGQCPGRPPGIDDGLWFALDRYRRDLEARIGRCGLVQWSGSYRLRARRIT